MKKLLVVALAVVAVANAAPQAFPLCIIGNVQCNPRTNAPMTCTFDQYQNVYWVRTAYLYMCGMEGSGTVC